MDKAGAIMSVTSEKDELTTVTDELTSENRPPGLPFRTVLSADACNFISLGSILRSPESVHAREIWHQNVHVPIQVPITEPKIDT